jgi:hypothetical protein
MEELMSYRQEYLLSDDVADDYFQSFLKYKTIEQLNEANIGYTV